jgi:hypothetical protein
VFLTNCTVDASGNWGAGIGAGIGSRGGFSRVLNLTIVDCEIHAVAGYGAAIGAGYAYEGNSSIGNLYVVNGEFLVNATMGAGIGSGNAEHSGSSYVERLTITNAVVNAAAEDGAAAIGSGVAGSDGLSFIRVLVINGGVYDATGMIQGAGIGSGEGNGGISFVDSVVILGGTFTLMGGFGSGLGAGWANHNGESQVGELFVFNGTFNSQSTGGSAIGAGIAFSGSSHVKIVHLIGGEFDLIGTADVGVIGTGFANAGDSLVETIRITGGTYRITAGINAPAIGTALHSETGTSRIFSMLIQDAVITADAEVVIGNMEVGVVNRIEFDGAVTLQSRARHHCINASQLFGDGALLGGVIASPLLLGIPFESNSTVTLRIVSTVPLSKDPISFPAIEVGEVTGIGAEKHSLRIQGGNDDFEIEFDAAVSKGVLVTVAQYGDFKISCERPGKEAVKLCHDNKEMITISADNWYLASLGKCPDPFPLALVLACSIGGGILVIGGIGFVVYRHCRPKPKPLDIEPGVLSTPNNVIHDPFISRT